MIAPKSKHYQQAQTAIKMVYPLPSNGIPFLPNNDVENGKMRLSKTVSNLPLFSENQGGIDAPNSIVNQVFTCDLMLLRYTSNLWKDLYPTLDGQNNPKKRIYLGDEKNTIFEFPKQQVRGNFNRTCIVYFGEYEFCTLQYEPNSLLTYTEQTIVLKISNYWLYQGKECADNLRYLEQALKLHFEGFTGIDIALDQRKDSNIGNQRKHKQETGLLAFWGKLYRTNVKQTRKLVHTGKAKLSGYDRQETGNPKTLYIGKYGGQKYIKVYDKTLDIAPKSKHEHKASYIVPYWKDKGLDHSKGVDRFELHLGSSKAKSIEAAAGKGIDRFRLLYDESYLADIMREFVEGFADVITQIGVNEKGKPMYKADNKKGYTTSKRRAQETQFIDWSDVGNGEVFTNVKPLEPSELNRARRCISDLVRQYFRTRNKEFLNSINEICKDYTLESCGFNLSKWVIDMWSRWCKKYAAKSSLDGVISFDELIGILDGVSSLGIEHVTSLGVLLDLLFDVECSTRTYNDVVMICSKTGLDTDIVLHRLISAGLVRKSIVEIGVYEKVEGVLDAGIYCPNGYPDFWDSEEKTAM